jgi:hypothetical protein
MFAVKAIVERMAGRGDDHADVGLNGVVVAVQCLTMRLANVARGGWRCRANYRRRRPARAEPVFRGENENEDEEENAASGRRHLSQSCG